VGAGLRLAFTSRLARPLRNVVSALFSLYIAFSFSEFYANVLRGAGLMLALFVGLAAMVLANAMISHFIPRRRGLKPQAPS
jgi:fatty acid desaturase